MGQFFLGSFGSLGLFERLRFLIQRFQEVGDIEARSAVSAVFAGFSFVSVFLVLVVFFDLLVVGLLDGEINDFSVFGRLRNLFYIWLFFLIFINVFYVGFKVSGRFFFIKYLGMGAGEVWNFFGSSQLQICRQVVRQVRRGLSLELGRGWGGLGRQGFRLFDNSFGLEGGEFGFLI